MKQAKTYYDFLDGQGSRIQVHQGGTSSAKTWSIIMGFIQLLYQNKNQGLVLSVVRESLPVLKRSVLRDFETICAREGVRFNSNKSTLTYEVFGNVWEFFSLDGRGKAQGPRRDFLWCNEATEITKAEFDQLESRTRKMVVLDYNPSYPLHWIYDHVLTRDNVKYYETNYKHNPFLQEAVVRSIESRRETDPEYWQVYGLGKRGTNRLAVFVAEPGEPKGKFIGYGLDFGFSNPSALVGVYFDDNETPALYIEQKIYQRALSTQELGEKCKEICGRELIIADPASPDRIAELRKMGLNIRGAKKGKDSVQAGIGKMKRFKLYYKGEDLGKEFSSYRWVEDKQTGLPTDIPEKKHDHAIDAARYVVSNLIGEYTGEYHVK